MGGLAAWCVAEGWTVTGSDHAVYPPMSDQLRGLGITLSEGSDLTQLQPRPDLVVIGNALSRGHPVVEAVLDQGIPFLSGPALWGQLTRDRIVLAVSGTHGKTTTSSLLAHILDVAGLNPGFLIGGVPLNFGVSARQGTGPVVVEADEYDTTFFDKRSKFLHYHPDVFGINNLEFDHADIFPDLAAIERQFQHGLRVVPGRGHVVARTQEAAIERVLAAGCWSTLVRVGMETDYQFAIDGDVICDKRTGQWVGWVMRGQHNAANAELAVAMAVAAGVARATAFTALGSFQGVARRLNCLGVAGEVTVWDDFAHHPTAIALTLAAVREVAGPAPVTAVIELRSNTMKAGVHAEALPGAVQLADVVHWVVPEAAPLLATSLADQSRQRHVWHDLEALISRLSDASAGHLVLMSNGGFGGIQERVFNNLKSAQHSGL